MADEEKREPRFQWVANDAQEHLKVHYMKKTKTAYKPDGSSYQVKTGGVVRFIHPSGHFDFTEDDFDDLIEVVAEIFEANEVDE